MDDATEARLAAIEIVLGLAVATMPLEQGRGIIAGLDELLARMEMEEGRPPTLTALGTLRSTIEEIRSAVERAQARHQGAQPE